MKFSITLFTVVFLISCTPDRPAEPTVETVSISLPTIQCSSCDNTVSEALMKVDGIQSAKVDLDLKTVAISYVTASLTIDELESVITNVGYDANDKKADKAAYEKLDACCKLPEDDAPETMDSM